jgi:N-formylglutamate amidohydrolase
MTSAWTAPFRRIGPVVPASPVVIAVPHAGRHYPAALLAASAAPRSVLEQLEDRHADLLVTQAVAEGAVAIVAQLARAWIDLNRGPDETEPPEGSGTVATSPRARSGLGLGPSRRGRQRLLRRLPDDGAIAERLAAVHEPYHRALDDALAAAVRLHGRATLLDCHSMPPLRGGVQLVVGDLHGQTADPALVEAALEAGRGAGYRVALNRPYAGAYTLARHARRPEIDAIQVEVDRAAYLDPSLREPGPGLDRAAAAVAALCRRLGEIQCPMPIAAE